MAPLSFIKILGNLKFLSHQLKLGTEWDSKYSIKDEAEQANKGDLSATPQLIPPWFMPAEIPSKYHQESCDKIGQDFKDFHDTMIDAVGYAHNMWKLKAKFKDIQVMSLSAIGSPGCLDGPELENDIKNAPMCASFSGNKGKHRDAVAKGISKAFKNWQDQVTVPGLPFWPAFVAFPGPQAPPMPNIPMPLIACVSSKMTDIMMPDTMKSEMDDALDGGLKDKDKTKQYEALHDAIATVCALAFTIWLPSQMVMLMMGKGPIPTFAPPFVPVGPVVGGDILGTGGQLMA
jgi:hypothetical protein